MAKPISKNDILRLLRRDAIAFSASPNLWRILTFEKMDIGNTHEDPKSFEIEVSCQHHNYVSLIRNFYNSDTYGMIQNGMYGSNDFSFVPYLKTIIDQLKSDGYLCVAKQTVKYHTEYSKTVEYDAAGPNGIYQDAQRFFSPDEKDALEIGIILTTKGQNWFSFWKDQILSEPIGLFSLIISILALVLSIIL